MLSHYASAARRESPGKPPPPAASNHGSSTVPSSGGMSGRITWKNSQNINAHDFRCSYCGREVSTDCGFFADNPDAGQAFTHPLGPHFFIAICPRCGNPTYLKGSDQIPAAPFGDGVDHLPPDVAALYQEARSSVRAGNYTAATMVGRKLLMNVAVAKGAGTGKTFQTYVDHLAKTHIITSDMGPWVDEVRKIGNEANHEIALTTKEQAEDLVTFLGMLLKIVYEYPTRHHARVQARTATESPAEPETSAS